MKRFQEVTAQQEEKDISDINLLQMKQHKTSLYSALKISMSQKLKQQLESVKHFVDVFYI